MVKFGTKLELCISLADVCMNQSLELLSCLKASLSSRLGLYSYMYLGHMHVQLLNHISLRLPYLVSTNTINFSRLLLQFNGNYTDALAHQLSNTVEGK